VFRLVAAVAALGPGRDQAQLQASEPGEHEEFADLYVLRPRG
jgi:hypothetical protein